jgi:hypothetical protein
MSPTAHFEHGVCALAIDLDFGEQWEGHVVLTATESRNLSLASRLLLAKAVAWKGQHRKAMPVFVWGLFLWQGQEAW